MEPVDDQKNMLEESEEAMLKASLKGFAELAHKNRVKLIFHPATQSMLSTLSLQWKEDTLYFTFQIQEENYQGKLIKVSDPVYRALTKQDRLDISLALLSDALEEPGSFPDEFTLYDVLDEQQLADTIESYLFQTFWVLEKK